MPKAPIFTDARGNRWSLGSHVVARWWRPDTSDAASGGKVVEQSCDGIVARIWDDQPGKSAWRIQVDFGPALNLLWGNVKLWTTQIEAVEAAPGAGAIEGDG